jgi:hypothetical protein
MTRTEPCASAEKRQAGSYASEEGRLVGLLLRGKALWVWIGIRTVGKFRG